MQLHLRELLSAYCSNMHIIIYLNEKIILSQNTKSKVGRKLQIKPTYSIIQHPFFSNDIDLVLGYVLHEISINGREKTFNSDRIEHHYNIHLLIYWFIIVECTHSQDLY